MAKGKEFKRPSIKSSKNFIIPDIEPSPDYDSYKLIFSLKYIQYQGPYCISKCESEKKSHILDTILRLSQYTWSQLKSISKDTAFEILPRLRFKASLPPVLTPEVPILVVRYDKEGRIAGFREKDIFHIVLVGKDLYPH